MIWFPKENHLQRGIIWNSNFWGIYVYMLDNYKSIYMLIVPFSLFRENVIISINQLIKVFYSSIEIQLVTFNLDNRNPEPESDVVSIGTVRPTTQRVSSDFIGSICAFCNLIGWTSRRSFYYPALFGVASTFLRPRLHTPVWDSSASRGLLPWVPGF